MRASLLLLLVLPAMGHAGAKQVAQREGANIQRPQLSADGSLLAYEANFHDKKSIELFVGPSDGTAFKRVLPNDRGASTITTGFGRTGPEVAHELSFSPPQYARYVYSAAGPGGDYDLYMAGAGPIAQGPGADGGAAWSPDGARIAFTSARTGEGDIYLINVASIEGPARQLTFIEGASELFVAWSPDSLKLAFVSHSTAGDNLWLVDFAGGKPRQLTTWSGVQTHPSFSPDGHYIAFYANRQADHRFDLYVMEARVGATPRRVATDVVINASGPKWSPSSAQLLFVCNDDAQFDPLCTVHRSAAKAPTVLDVGTIGHGDLDVVAAPGGGSRVAYVAQGLAGDAERSFKRLFVVDLPSLE